jgi:hypothetical protein
VAIAGHDCARLINTACNGLCGSTGISAGGVGNVSSGGSGSSAQATNGAASKQMLK